jgi:enoyl-CoA hydratase/carnithine racemase
VAWLTLNRPQVLNALDREMVRQYTKILNRIRADESVRVVVTRGAGRAFCSGSDLRELAPLSAAEATSLERGYGEAFGLLDSLPQPTLALIHGYALGGGLQVTLYHDFRIASGSAVFGLPEVELGWTPPWSLGRTVDLLGGAAARWFLLTCEKIDAARALEMGLVNEVVPDSELLSRGEALARRLASFPPEGLARTKALLHRMSELRSDHWEGVASADFLACFESRESRRKVRDFVDRRGK